MFTLPRLIFTVAAWAANTDEAVTSVGSTSTWTGSLARADVDFVFSERARWKLGDAAGLTWRARVDGRWTVDPKGPNTWEQSRLRVLGLLGRSGDWTVEVGRSAVAYGGPRLVDGVQARYRFPSVEVGVWGGEVPDLYTSTPAARFGGGPVVSFHHGQFSGSVVGEALFGGGGFDRAGVLLLASVAGAPLYEVTARLDAQVAGPVVGPTISDGAVNVRWMPHDSVRFSAFYDAYSTFRYIRTAGEDPDIRRFAERIQALGVSEQAYLDDSDPRTYHLVGGDARWQASGALPAPRLSASARYRWHPDVERRYARATGSASWVADTWQLGVDGAAHVTDEGPRGEAGLSLWTAPVGSTPLAFDASVRLIVDLANPTGAPPGGYADLFVDWLGPANFAVIAGGTVYSEPGMVRDIGVGGFLKVQHRLRPGRSADATELQDSIRLP